MNHRSLFVPGAPRLEPVLSVLSAALIGAAVMTSVNCSKKASTPTEPPRAVCSVSPTTLDFGIVAAGQTSERSFTVRNVGGGVLSGVVTVPAGAFSLIGSPDYYLSAGQSASFRLTYAWQHAGPAQAMVTLSSAGCTGVQCSAVGGASPCGVSLATLSFGHVVLGATKELQFSVTNTGTADFFTSAYDTCTDFPIIGPTNFQIQPGKAATYTVRFTPSRPGAQTCTIPLSSICTPVVCTAIGDPTPCYVSPLVLDFGTVRLNEYATQSFVLRNDGTTQLSGRLDIPSGDNLCGSFYLPNSDSTYDLAPGASKSILVAIQPRVIGSPVSCTFSTGPAPCAQVTCQAVVTPPEFGSCSGWSVTPSSLDFGNVTVGQSATRTVHISAPADCIYSGARLDVIISGPDFTFADGTSIKHVGLDLGVNWTFDVKFTPSVQGEESLGLVTYRACGPPGSPGFPCQGVLGRGAGIPAAAQGAWRRPAAWRSKGR